MYPVWDGTPACSGTETDLWFPIENSKAYANKTLLQRTCKRCPVQMQCAEYSIHNDVQGYWAGTSDEQRRKIRRARGIVAISLLSNLNEWKPAVK